MTKSSKSNKSESLKEIFKREFGHDLPISGGTGNSIDNAIKIDKEYEDWSDVLYTCLRLSNRLLQRNWKIVLQTTIEKNGRTFDKIKLEIEGDDKNYYNYYFDISDHLNSPLYGGGTAWPDKGDLRKRFKI